MTVTPAQRAALRALAEVVQFELATHRREGMSNLSQAERDLEYACDEDTVLALLDDLDAAEDALRNWTVCFHCGERMRNADAEGHGSTCTKHPMRALEAREKRLREALDGARNAINLALSDMRVAYDSGLAQTYVALRQKRDELDAALAEPDAQGTPR